jgi:NADH-quinone oxidoreductase subunit D
MEDVESLLTRNRIFMDRMSGTGVLDPKVALAYGVTGPCLRGSGIDLDVRKDHPYLLYSEVDFDVPVGEKGDNYDRYLVRMEEIRQAVRICRQVLVKLRTETGPINVDAPNVVLPDKQAVYHSIEGMMNHFKLIYEGIQVPKGEVYSYTETPNGELGFYIVSQGRGRPYKLRVRPPCFATLAAAPKMLEGGMLADIVPTFGSINMIGGECDR